MTATDLVVPDKEKLRQKVIANIEMTTVEEASTKEELELWTIIGLEAKTDVQGADLEVTT